MAHPPAVHATNNTDTTTTEPTKAPLRIGVISCSARKPRLNPYITDYVTQILHRNAAFAPEHVTLTHIDLGTPEHELPYTTSEPLVPAQLPKEDPTPHYVSPQIRAWSALVASCQAFVFVTPQYNWSYPATVKNAIDLLFHEWGGKVAAVVTYGGHGGVKAADHLGRVLGACKMRVVGGSEGAGMPSVPITLSLRDECVALGRVPDATLDSWKGVGLEDRIAQLGRDLIGMLDEQC